MSNKKYTLIESDTVTTPDGRKLYRIKALAPIAAHGVNRGDLGGYIESEANLSVDDWAWVAGNAWIYGNAQVYDYAHVYGNAQVHGNAWVSNYAHVYGNAWVFGNAWVSGTALVC